MSCHVVPALSLLGRIINRIIPTLAAQMHNYLEDASTERASLVFFLFCFLFCFVYKCNPFALLIPAQILLFEGLRQNCEESSFQFFNCGEIKIVFFV